MNPKKERPVFGPNNQDIDVVVVDDSNSVFDGTRRPARSVMRKIIQERLEKEKKLLELKEKYYGEQDDGSNGKQTDAT